VRVAVQLLARSDRRAGCVTRGRGPPCWVRWKSEGRAHLARLHAACSSRILGGDPGGDGPGVMMKSSFRVEILGPRRRPRLGRTSPKV
jgi:hypothetical protein